MDTHETKIYIALLIAIAILLIFLTYFIVTIIGHQRRNQALYLEKINAEIATLEKERSRIASDLHDDLGPMLSSVKLLVNNLNITTGEDNRTLLRANHVLDAALTQLNTISNDLVPQTLSIQGLVLAIQEYVEEINETRDMHVEFIPEPGLVIHPDQNNHLYRIVREVIHNAGKHAMATQMDIRMEQKKNMLILSMCDNGRGFDIRDQKLIQKGLGLKNIMSRVEALKGNIYLTADPGKGTHYLIEIP